MVALERAAELGRIWAYPAPACLDGLAVQLRPATAEKSTIPLIAVN
jgi:hypothetical protein